MEGRQREVITIASRLRLRWFPGPNAKNGNRYHYIKISCCISGTKKNWVVSRNSEPAVNERTSKPDLDLCALYITRKSALQLFPNFLRQAAFFSRRRYEENFWCSDSDYCFWTQVRSITVSVIPRLITVSSLPTFFFTCRRRRFRAAHLPSDRHW